MNSYPQKGALINHQVANVFKSEGLNIILGTGQVLCLSL